MIDLECKITISPNPVWNWNITPIINLKQKRRVNPQPLLNNIHTPFNYNGRMDFVIFVLVRGDRSKSPSPHLEFVPNVQQEILQ
jgi:hypothetical protein